MVRPLWLFALLLAPIPSQAHAEETNSPRNPSLAPSEQALLRRLTNAWKESFRSMPTLDCQWKKSATFDFDPGVRHTYAYRFTRAQSRHRLDTLFQSSRPNKDNIQTSTLLYDGFFKTLDVRRSGVADLSVRPYSQVKRNPYGAIVPVLRPFVWAFDKESFSTIEELAGEAFWTRLIPRVQHIASGRWQGYKGWWLSVVREDTGDQGEKRTRETRVFVEEASLFPFFYSGKSRIQSADLQKEAAFSFQVTKTQPYFVAGQKRLLPACWQQNGWSLDLRTGKRTTDNSSEELTAPVQINQIFLPKRWELSIPRETLIRFATHEGVDMSHESVFTFNSAKGTLWQQEKNYREQRAARERQLAASPIYDQKADGEAQIKEALELAQAQHKGVLLQFGANWCSPCHVLHKLLQNDPQIAPIVRDNFIVASIDVNEGHNERVVKRLQGPHQGGLPFIVLLKSSGERIAAPPSEIFNDPQTGGFDTNQIIKFLTYWKTQL